MSEHLLSQQPPGDYAARGDATPEIASVLRLAFGRSVPVTAIPLPLGQASHSLAFALDDPALPPRVLLRRYPPLHQPRGLCAFTAQQALRALNFCVPDVYYLGWSYHSRFLLMLTEHADGRGAEGQPHPFFMRVGVSFAQRLAHLHGLRWGELPDLPVKPRGFLLDGLNEAAETLGNPELRGILDWLEPRAAHVPELPHTVTHGDYTLHNVLAEGTQIAAILGWESAAIADPRLDVGYSSAALATYGLPLADQFVEAYEAAAGRIADRVFWETLGALRLMTRIAQTLAQAHPADVEDRVAQVWPVWENLLLFVENRTRASA